MDKVKVVMLVCDVASSRIIYHKLKTRCEIVAIVMEEKVSSKILLKNRVKKLGFFRVFGQVCFMVLNVFLKKLSKQRIKEIQQNYDLDTSSIDFQNTISVKSINDDRVKEVLSDYDFDMVLVNGTRIIKNEILSTTDKPFVNTHTGITPKYRGVHGGYWALANDDKNNCGVTVHLVDGGIDTGNVLYQSLIQVTHNDSFNTYPYLQTTKAIDLLENVFNDVKNYGLKPKKPLTKDSALWSHPTVFEYIKNYIKLGVK